MPIQGQQGKRTCETEPFGLGSLLIENILAIALFGFIFVPLYFTYFPSLTFIIMKKLSP